MNHYVESDLEDYGIRSHLGNAGENLTWILKNRSSLDLSEYDMANILRCCQYKMWSSSMCKWLDSVRSLNDEDYLNKKTEKKIKSIQKKMNRDVDMRIASLNRKVSDLRAQIERLGG